jgi:hypothetical protein
MPIEAPILDDRSYDQLREELVQRLTVTHPEYTDQLPSDPIITLLELVATLGETVLYRFNQIPTATRHEFLRLLGVQLRAASPATSMVAFTRSNPLNSSLEPAVVGQTVTRGTVVRSGDVPFVLDQALDVFPLVAVGAIKQKVPIAKATDVSGPAVAVPTYVQYNVVVVDPKAPANLIDAAEHSLWIACVADDKPMNGIDLARFRATLPGRVISVGVTFNETAVQPEFRLPYQSADDGGTDLICEMLTHRPVDSEPVFTRCDLVSDTSRGLRRSGVLKVVVPVLDSVAPPRDGYDGVDANPPVLPKASDNDRALAWLRIARRSTTDHLAGEVTWVGLNAVNVTQGERASAELLGVGTGNGRQLFRLTNRNSDPSTVFVDVEETAGNWVSWTRVDSLADVGQRDRNYELDAEAGTIRCGDGYNGFPFPAGSRVRVRDYLYCLGLRGNVAAESISKTEIGSLKVSNPGLAVGGTDAEKPEDAVDRIPQEIRRRDRAVTASDFKELVLGMPGVDVGRAETIMTCRPNSPELYTAGAVTVVVWPTAPLTDTAPKPTRTTLDRVCRYLDPRRLATTELYVAPPIYVPVAVSVAVVPLPGQEREATNAFVAQLIRQYLAALPPYGPDGQGYPLGRELFAAELAAIALQVASVRFVSDLKLAVLVGPDGLQKWETRTRVEFRRNELPSLQHIDVVSGPPNTQPPAFPPVKPKVPVSQTPALRPAPITRTRC